MNTDLERELRDLLSAEAGSAPPPRDVGPALRMTRRRQVLTAATAVAGVTGVLVAATAGLRLLDRSAEPAPGGPTRTAAMNGVGITIPQSWALIDPDEAGFNGPTGMGTPQLPRMILALAPFDPGELFACPGIAESPHTFLMTLQEEPLALAGPSAAPWPSEVEALDASLDESGCYPGWELLRAGWTASGRTFEARLGFAPDVSDADRGALLAAFASLTFEPAADEATSVMLATGSAGGEEWQLIATRQPDGLGLSLQAESIGGGTGGYDPSSDELPLTSFVLGEGASAERVVFAAVPAEIVVIAGQGPTSTVYPEILDVPDRIDPRTNAFVAVVDADAPVAFVGFNATDDLVASGGLDADGNPLSRAPDPDEVIFDGRTNDCWWTLGRTSDGSGTELVRLVSPLGNLLVELVADVGPDAPAIQVASYTCPIGSGGTLVFGVLTDEVADVRWPSDSGYGVPECWPAGLPDRFCLFLLDGVGDAGEAIAMDADGNEIGRATFP